MRNHDDQDFAPMLSTEPSSPTTTRPSKSSPGGPKLFEGLREYPKVSLYCLALTSAILLWGYDMAMTGNLYGVDAFKKDYGYFNEEKNEWTIASMWLGLWNASAPLGMMFGAIAGGTIQDRWGRRMSLGIGSVTSAIGVAVVFASTYTGPGGRQVVMMIGKFLQGLTIGVVVCTTQTYISEVLPSTLRGPLLAFFPIFFLFGQLISALIIMQLEKREGRMSYVTAIISEWPFSVVPAVLAVFLPESPVYLIRKGNLGGALKAQRRLDSAHMNSAASIGKLQMSLRHEEEKSNSSRSTYMDCLKNTDLRRTGIATFSAVLPQLYGLPILGDGPYFLQKAGMEKSKSFIFLLTGILCGLLGTVISMWLLTFIGRRKLILWTLTPLVFLWTGMGIAGCINSIVSAWVVGIVSNSVALIAALGVWSASYVVTSEVSSLRLRAKTQGIAWALSGLSNLVFSMGTPYIYNDDAGNLGAKIGFVWVGICGATTVAAWYLIPEMLGRSSIQLDQMFEQKIPARHFSKWHETESGSELGQPLETLDSNISSLTRGSKQYEYSPLGG